MADSEHYDVDQKQNYYRFELDLVISVFTPIQFS